MATKVLSKTSLTPASKVTPVNKQPVVRLRTGPGVLPGSAGPKQSGPTGGAIPTGSGLLGSGGFFTPRPPTAGEDLPGWIGYALSDPLNQGAYRDAATGETTAAGNLPDQISGAVEKAALNLGAGLQDYLIQQGGWIVALVVVIALLVISGQAFLRG